MNNTLFKWTYEDADDELAMCDDSERFNLIWQLGSFQSLENDEFMRLLGKWWSKCTGIGQSGDALWDTYPFMESDFRGPIQAMMTPEELEAWASLPDTLTIYRGCYDINKWGWSWSLSKELAKQFPLYLRYRRPGEQPLLVTARIPKTEIIALKLDRGEPEIIAWRPKHLSTHRMKAPGNNALVFEGPALG